MSPDARGITGFYCNYDSDVFLSMPNMSWIFTYVLICMKGRILSAVVGTGLHNGERHNQYSSASINRIIRSRSMKWAGHIAHQRERRNASRILMGKPEGKRPRHMWVDNIKIDLKRDKMGCYGLD
jgi:hypothetical protein